MNRTLIVTAGVGPEEVRRFVNLLSLRLMRRFTEESLTVSNVIFRGPVDAPSSIQMDISGDDFKVPVSELGTHVLIAASSKRKKSCRKRWFARVALVDTMKEDAEDLEARFQEADVEVSTCRSSGPGGQHVNKTASAVRAVHRPSGIVVRVESQRSQHANRIQAMKRIKEALHQSAAMESRAAQHRLRHEHYLVERGNPVRIYVLDNKGQLETIHD